MRVLVTVDAPPLLAAAEAWLTAGGHVADQGVPCLALVQEAVRQAPDAVLLVLPDTTPASCQAALALADLLQAALAVPLVLWAHGPAAAVPPPWRAAALAAGVHAWWLGSAPPPAGLLDDAVAQQQRLHALQQELQRLRAQLDDRKWVDRAKGLLMRGGLLSEDEAFGMLRVASMQANLRLGEVSRGVIETACLAEEVNRAGQLRMLSQRQVKALAQCVAGVQLQESERQLSASSARISDNLAFLGAQTLDPGLADLLAEAGQAWRALKCFSQPRAAELAQADSAAQALLQAAEALTAGLEAAAGRRPVHVVNLCGRQRMLSQRLAKEALLATLLPADEAARRAALVADCAQEFERAHAQLVQAPLSTPAIREGLAQVRGLWQRLTRAALQDAPDGGRSPQARQTAAARASDELLDALERLTERFESSLQLLMA